MQRRTRTKLFATFSATFFATALLLVPVLGVRGSVSASANSGIAYWSGTDGVGVLPGEENCPAEVEREELTFEISSLPVTFDSQAQFESYTSRVTAEYTLFNPTDGELSVRLMFPFGAAPEYLRYFSSETEEWTQLDDSARYFVTVNGERAETQLRHTYAHSSLALPGTAAKDGFFHADTQVRTYSYEVTDDEKGGDHVLEAVLTYNPDRTKIMLDEWDGCYLENGDLVVRFALGGKTPCFYAAGDAPTVKQKRVVRKGGYGSEPEIVAGATVKEDVASAIFSAWAESYRIEGVEANDWMSICAAFLGNEEESVHGVIYRVPASIEARDLMRWLEYTVVIPAKGSVKNAVTAPLYPDISGRSYRFSYLLSPARSWASFGTLSMKISTDYSVEDCSLDLTKEDGGYIHVREGLPIDELRFTIYGESFGGGEGQGSLQGILIVVCLVAIPLAGMLTVGLTFGIYFGVRASKRRKARREQNSK